MTRRLRIALLPLALVAASAASCDKSESTTLDEKLLPHVRVASVELIAPRPRSRHLAPLQPFRRARLSPRTGGQVLTVGVDEEDVVEQGAVLVRFAAQDSKGGLISAKATIEQLEEALRDNAREQEDARALVAKGAGTTREVESLETQRASLKAQVRAAKGQLVQAKDRVGAATLVAPFSGTITAVQTEAGEFIAPGVVAVVLSQLDPISVEVPLTQADVALYDAQGGLEFAVQARGKARDAKIEYVSSESADGSTFTARLELPNADTTLRAGELVDVEVFGARKAQVKAVPFTAVRWAAEQPYVLKVAQDNTIERVDIRVVDESQDQVIIETIEMTETAASEANAKETSSLSEGDRVVETGPIALRPGDAVEVVAAPGDTLAAG